jgi:hypothetical protein
MRQDNEDSRYFEESKVDSVDTVALEKLKLDADKLRKEIALKEKELAETVRSNKAKEEIQKIAAKKKPSGK